MRAVVYRYFRLPLHRRRGRVLELGQVGRTPRAIRGPLAMSALSRPDGSRSPARPQLMLVKAVWPVSKPNVAVASGCFRVGLTRLINEQDIRTPQHIKNRARNDPGILATNIKSVSPAACPPCVLCASKTASEINLFRCVSFGIWRDLRFSFSLTGFVAARASAEQHDEPAAPHVDAAYRTLKLPRKHPYVLGRPELF